MKIEYELDEADLPGWAKARVITEKTTREMTVSYLADSLSLLAKAALELGGSANRATIPFYDEPGEHNLVLRKTGSTRLNARLYWIKEWRGSVQNSDNPTHLVAQSNMDLRAFQQNVLEILGRLLQKHGLAGYKAKWLAHDFPIALHELLKTLMGD